LAGDRGFCWYDGGSSLDWVKGDDRMRTQRWLRTIAPVGWAIVAMPLMVMPPVVAQTVVPDTTLGAESSTVTPDEVIRGVLSDRIEGGATRGGNLFHSFERFAIDAGRGVYFANPAGIENILSRVTGNSRSDIFGRLGVLGNANLFLLNSNGIVFGPNANLDIVGSFTATTANAIQLGDRGFFSASAPEPPSQLLTINPSAFLFNQIAAQPIVNQSRAINPNVPTFIDGLRVNDEQSLLLLGGDVILDGGLVQARGGRVEIGGIRGSGVVGLTVTGNVLDLTFPHDATLADITLRAGVFGDRASIDTSGFANTTTSAGGEIQTHSRNLTLTNNSVIASDTFGSRGGGNISLRASDIEMLDQSSVLAITYSDGDSGNIEINADRLRMQNSAQISTITFLATGNGGKIFVQADESIDLQNNSQVGSLSVGRGDQASAGQAGDIVIRTDVLNLQNSSGMISNTFIGGGNAGNIDIQADTVTLLYSALTSSSYGVGVGGNISVKTNSLFINQGSLIVTSTFDISSFLLNSLSGTYPSELIDLIVDLRNSASLDQLGQANAGNLSITAANLVEIIGTSPNGDTGSQLSTDTFGDGRAGDLTITTGNLRITEGGSVSSNSRGAGRGGDIQVNASNAVDISGLSPNRAFVSFLGSEATNTGSAGDIVITSRSLTVQGGAFISTQTFGQGEGGNLTVSAIETMTLSDTAVLDDQRIFQSGLFTTTGGAGASGNIRVVDTERLVVQGGAVVNASTFSRGAGGNVEVDADTVEILGLSRDRLFQSALGSESTGVENGGRAGDVQINSRNIIVLDGLISTQTFGTGRGGDLSIKAHESMLLSGTGTRTDGSTVGGISTATRGTASGGDLQLETRQLIVRDGAGIIGSTFNTGRAGDVTVKADSIELLGGSANGLLKSGIASQSEVFGEGGDAGNVTVTTRALNIKDGAGISTATFGQGRGGNLTVHVRESTELSGFAVLPDGSPSASELSIRTIGSGDTGILQLFTGSLNIRDGAAIFADASGAGRAGNINIFVDGTLKMDTGLISSASSFSEGGTITVRARDIRLQRNSDITTNVFSGAGGGGDITLTANSIVALGDSDILSFARDGRGGNVTLNTRAFFGQNYRPALFGTDPRTLNGNNRVDINASGTVFGIITLPDVSFIQSSLTQLAQTAIDTNQLLATSCIVRRNQPNPSSFYITGPGGLPDRPGTPSSPSFPTGEIRNIAGEPPNSPHTSHLTPHTSPSWQIGDPIQEPDGVYQLPNGELVLSHTCR
jgi:filamentous hemagglutinin family protein